MILPAQPPARRFEFHRDTFAFANELVWQYRFDSKTGATTTFRTEPPPTYSHRCFVLVRSARQFLYHARFAPDLPPSDAQTYSRSIRQIVARSPRHPSRSERRVVIPGFDSLRTFSQTHAAALKANCGGAWQSYCLRSHWRMVFPISRNHQARCARNLELAIGNDLAPIVHLFRFPQLTINHGIILFDKSEQGGQIIFRVYDPNLPGGPTELAYDAATQTFLFPRNHYWAGGRVDVVQTYYSWLF